MLERYRHLSAPEKRLDGNGWAGVAATPRIPPSKVPVLVTVRLEDIAVLEPLAPNGNERALNGKSDAQEDDKVCRKSDSGRARH
jgi:hypothetical protein